MQTIVTKIVGSYNKRKIRATSSGGTTISLNYYDNGKPGALDNEHDRVALVLAGNLGWTKDYPNGRFVRGHLKDGNVYVFEDDHIVPFNKR